MVIPFSSAFSADVTSTDVWGTGNNANWSNHLHWSNSPSVAAYPKNGNAGGSTFDVIVNSASLALTEHITIENLTFGTRGLIGGGFNLTLNNSLTWTGGTLGVTNVTVAGVGSTIAGFELDSQGNVVGTEKYLVGTLTNTGAMTYSSSLGVINLNGTLNNSGTFNTTAGGDFVGGGNSVINNSGTWNVSGPNTTSSVTLSFHNTGTVNVQSGTFEMLRGAGNTTGSFNVAPGATIRLGTDSYANFNLANSSSISGGGAVEFTAGGTIHVNGTYNVTGSTKFNGSNVTFNAPVTSLGNNGSLTVGGNLNFNSTVPTLTSLVVPEFGTLGGSASINVGGDLTWSGGGMIGSGTTTVAGSASTISGTGEKVLARTLTNTGAMTYSSSLGVINLNGTLNNSGTFNTTAGGDFVGGGNSVINNSGTWNVSGPNTTSSVALPFHNTGTVNVQSGTAVFNGTYTQTAGVLALVGGNLSMPSPFALQGGHVQISSGTLNATSGPFVVQRGKVRIGSGTLTTAGELWVADSPTPGSSHGAFTVVSGTASIGNWLAVGRNGNGSMNVEGGSLTVTTNNISLGAFTGGYGVANITGGTVNVTDTAPGAGGLMVAETGNANLTISGSAAVNLAGSRGLHLGTNGGTGVVNLNGGTLTTRIVHKGPSTGILNLNGGTLKAGAASSTFMQGLTAAYVNSGGAIIDDGGFAVTVNQPLLAPTLNGLSSITATGSGYTSEPLVQISGDGRGATAIAKIDHNGNLTDVIITNPGVGYTSANVSFVGGGGSAAATSVGLALNNSTGGLTKRGNGTLTLAGENTYTGPTVIEAGTLALSGSISDSEEILVHAGAIFDVSGVGGGFTLTGNQTLNGKGTIIGSVVLGSGAELAPGESPGTLTLDGSLNITPAVTLSDSGALKFELGSFENSDKVLLSSGVLTIGTGVLGFGDFAFVALSGFGNGTYTLFDSDSAIAGTLDEANLSGLLGDGRTGTLMLADGGNDLVLDVVPEPNSAMLLVAGAGLMLGCRRRRGRHSKSGLPL